MNKMRQLLFSALCLLLASGVMAQTDTWEVNLAAINNVNVTLNDNCEAVVLPSMILTGDFDVDGDGEDAPDNLFDIVVEDNDPSNGPIIDGCGSWTWTATGMANSVDVPPVFGFVDDFAEANWDVTLSGAQASATFTATELTLTSGELGDSDFDNTDDVTV
ncbi:MAG: hypothetical protein AAFU67_04490, partial [Bacteroidota bacterium]